MKKKLLLVDDDPDLRESISSYLSHKGFLVTSKQSVQEALEVLQNYHVDLVITDIMMPDLDGYDLIRLLRLNQNLVNMPIIFLTAKGMTNDRIKGYDLGCNSYLSKPFDPDELVSIVRNLLKNFNPVSTNTLISQFSNVAHSSKSVFTPKEWTVFHLVYQGLMNKEIAAKLNLNLRTVEKHVSRLLSKTDTRNRTQLVKFALMNHLFDIRANDGTRTRE